MESNPGSLSFEEGATWSFKRVRKLLHLSSWTSWWRSCHSADLVELIWVGRILWAVSLLMKWITWAIPACSCVLDSQFLYVRRRLISLIHGMGLCRGRRTLLAEIKQSHRAGSETDSVTWQLQSLLWKKENSCLSEAFPLDHLCLFQSDGSVVKCTIAKNRCKMYIAHSLRPCTREILF